MAAGTSLLAWALSYRLLGLPYVSDDIALLEQLARLHAGAVDWVAYLSQPHNEHRVPVLRVLYLVTAGIGGFSALPLRLVLLAIHVGCALVVARITRRTWGPWPAAAAAAVTVGAVAFSSMPLWVPSTAIFSLSLLLTLVVCDQLQSGGRWARPIATIALVAATLSFNAAVLCVPVVVLAFWDRLGERSAQRIAWAAAWLGIAAVVFVWSDAALVAAPGAAGRSMAAAGNAAFLVASAPYRWLVTWITGSPGATPSWAVPLAATLGWAAAHLLVPVALRPVAWTLTLAASLIAGAVGFGRAEFPLAMLYTTDRYYYWFAAPFAIVTVSAVLRLPPARRRPAAACVAILLLAGVSGYAQSRRSLDPILDVQWVRAATRAMISAERLAQVLAESAAVRPLMVRNGFVPIDGMHSGGATLGMMSYLHRAAGISGLTLVAFPTPDSDARLNDLLERWAAIDGQAGAPVQARNGMLTPRLASRLDFSRQSFAAQIVDGFHDWDGRARWMRRRGVIDLARGSADTSLRLVARAPVSALRPRLPGAAFVVDVSVDGEVVGRVDFAAGDLVDQTFPLPAASSDRARVTLDSAFGWHAKQIQPDNDDPRELSISLEFIALEAGSSAGSVD